MIYTKTDMEYEHFKTTRIVLNIYEKCDVL